MVDLRIWASKEVPALLFRLMHEMQKTKAF